METKLFLESQIDEVTDLLLKDQVVAFPTETVFGLGIRYGSNQATQNMIKAKNRDESKLFTLMVPHLDEIEHYALITPEAKKLIDAFMPGDITLIFEAKEGMTNGPTIGIRIPDHPYTISLLEKVGAMYVTSANLSGLPSANDDQEVLAQLDGRIAGIVLGESGRKQASAVINTVGGIKILREGRINQEMINKVLGD